MENNIDVPKKLIPFFTSKKRYNVAYGGRGGSKSWTIALLLLIKSMERPGLALCCREIQNTIADSVYKLLVNTIYKWGWDSLFEIQKKKIVSIQTGYEFIFKGLRHNIQEVKSTEGITDCWPEEANSLSRESLDILWPTVREEESQIWISYNPDDINDPVHSDFVENTHPDALVININYDDNPFFPEVLRKEMEYDKEFNYPKYLHVWEGEIKKISDACIFKDNFTTQNFKTHDGVDFYYGADWGFSTDPTCLVRCYVHDGYLYIDHEAHGHGVELDEIAELFKTVPDTDENKIVGDNSRPDTISYLNKSKNGLIVRASKKGKNSIEDGIEFIKSFKGVIIHERCKNTIYEFKSYSYKKDRLTGEILPIIVDKDNHIIDSLRYALEDLRKGLGGKVSISKFKTQDILFK